MKYLKWLFSLMLFVSLVGCSNTYIIDDSGTESSNKEEVKVIKTKQGTKWICDTISSIPNKDEMHGEDPIAYSCCETVINTNKNILFVYNNNDFEVKIYAKYVSEEKEDTSEFSTTIKANSQYEWNNITANKDYQLWVNADLGDNENIKLTVTDYKLENS